MKGCESSGGQRTDRTKSDRKIALTPEAQSEFVQQMLLSEAQKDPIFKQFLLQQEPHMLESLPESIAIALAGTISQLQTHS